MALRFRRSIKLAPGIRWNFSGSGSSWTLGLRGASVNIGKRGTYLNTGVPATGLYSRERLGGNGPTRNAHTPTAARPSPGSQGASPLRLTCGISDEGTVYFLDASGQPVPDHWVESAKAQNRNAIQDLIARTCDSMNAQVEALGELHHDTPDPIHKPRFEPPPFELDEPRAPTPVVPSLFDRAFDWLLGGVRKIEQTNGVMQGRFEEAHQDWATKHRDYEREVTQRRLFVEESIYRDVAAMEEHLTATLQDIEWPRETAMSFDIDEQGRSVSLDVDLPEIEDMPTKLAAVPSRGLKLSVKEMSAARVQKLYAQHVHGIVFRIVGETFAALPTVDEVTVAGYSQRPDKSTGRTRDEYLISVHVVRTDWLAMNFLNLQHIDPAEALGRFDLRRNMLKSGALRSIEPHISRVAT